MESVEDSPVTPPLGREPLPRTLNRPTGNGAAYSSSDSLDLQSMHSRSNYDSCGVASTPKLSSISAAKTEISSMDASMRSTSSSRDADALVKYPSATPVIWRLNGSNRTSPVCTLPSELCLTVEESSDESDSAGRNSESYMLDYGGKRTEQGYISNTCDEWMLHFFFTEGSMAITEVCAIVMWRGEAI
ncbi:UNVERIFIED_CONTAM: protein Brevis radix-like 4 [Sesamum calycinum]|uniref:Protein Brevis radix-like 4 n=1 Tax=Sesamum calycinum TaxID=2727403 RepID=A0AAW2J1F0_9LAMI